MASRNNKFASFLNYYGYDLLLGSITAFYILMVPFTKVEESFNVQFYALLTVRMALGCMVLYTLRFFRHQIKNKFGHQVEAFFVIMTSIQFHFLFYCSRPLPNILALAIDQKNFSMECSETLHRDGILMHRLLWTEFEVFWFNSVLNKSSEWGTHAFHWYFTSALPRSLLAAYPLSLFGFLLDRRVRSFTFPVLAFILLYSKLPHKELRFIMSSVPVFNLSASIASNRILVGTITTFTASYWNYPSGHALKKLHQIGFHSDTNEQWVHIDTFSAMNGISRFCESGFPWRYSKEEQISLHEFQQRNFTFLIKRVIH